MDRTGIISKDRVKKNGEVFTPDEIVNDMLDMLDTEMASKRGLSDVNEIDDYEYIKDIRLEPTCGDGAILVRILDKKLGRVLKIQQQGDDWKEALLYSVASIYGVDITADNVVMSKRRLLEVIETGRTDVLCINSDKTVTWKTSGFELDTELKKLIQLILDYNIQCGNTLTNEFYKIYKENLNCWNCALDKINETNLFTTKLDEKQKELPGWEKETLDLRLTQWLFEGTQYINRQVKFEDYKDHMTNGTPLQYYKTRALGLYTKYKNPADDLVDEYDF